MEKKEAIKILKDFHDESALFSIRTALETLYPELKESEDERIIKILQEGVNDVLQDQFCTNRGVSKEKVLAWLEKQGDKLQKTSIWKHWKDGIAGNGEGEPIYLVKNGNTYSLNSCLGYECDYIELSELDNLMLEKQGETYTKRDVDDAWLKGMCDAKRELEKQSEQKPFDYENANIQRKDFAPKEEPKFKVGDWVVYYRNDSSREVLQVYDIRDGRYYFTDNVHFSWSVKECDEKSHLWTTQDAKDGDVLQLGKVTAIFKEFIGNGNCECYCSVWDGEFEIPSQDDNDNIYGCHNAIPATKEQRDLLFQKMKEAGYEWDADKKELKLLITNDGDFFESENCEQKPAEWSEEDEERLSDAIFFVREYQIPTRDKRLLNAAKETEDWLKSLKTRCTWKPSDEQMADLWNMLCECRPADHQLLQDIYYGLKKLREE